MKLGQLKLDKTESQALARCLIRDTLKDMGSILYDMRRMQRNDLAANTKGQVDAVLSKVLGLLNNIPS